MRLSYVILHVPDVTAAVAFYEHAFGRSRRFIHDSGQYAEMETGSTALALVLHASVEANGLPPGPADRDILPFGTEIALVTDDVQAAFRRALEAGAAGRARAGNGPVGREHRAKRPATLQADGTSPRWRRCFWR